MSSKNVTKFNTGSMDLNKVNQQMLDEAERDFKKIRRAAAKNKTALKDDTRELLAPDDTALQVEVPTTGEQAKEEAEEVKPYYVDPYVIPDRSIPAAQRLKRVSDIPNPDHSKPIYFLQEVPNPDGSGEIATYVEMAQLPVSDKERNVFFAYTVTQHLYDLVMGKNPSTAKLTDEELIALIGSTQGQVQDLPVTDVSWFDAAMFCNRFSQLIGHPTAYEFKYNDAGSIVEATCDESIKLAVRLPTVAEWLAAAKARKTYRFSGSDTAAEVAWTKENSGDKLHRVGLLKPNDWGMYDMTGNVWEWTNTQNN